MTTLTFSQHWTHSINSLHIVLILPLHLRLTAPKVMFVIISREEDMAFRCFYSNLPNHLPQNTITMDHDTRSDNENRFVKNGKIIIGGCRTTRKGDHPDFWFDEWMMSLLSEWKYGSGWLMMLMLARGQTSSMSHVPDPDSVGELGDELFES